MGAHGVESAGRFRLYLGAAAGVGKIYAMLTEDQIAPAWRKSRGDRRSTGGTPFEEMDLRAVLYRRPSGNL